MMKMVVYLQLIGTALQLLAWLVHGCILWIGENYLAMEWLGLVYHSSSSIKNSQNTKKQQTLSEDTNFIENIIAIDLGQSIMILSKYIHILRFLFSPILNITCKMQKGKRQDYFQEVTTSKDGLLQSQVCANTQTRSFIQKIIVAAYICAKTRSWWR